ncbi:hypothetical protein OG894_01615 [Streptomyces sp. NBC_01724]|nr:hypothetical protein [Streptomyces sp. NBC_01724]
MAVFSSFLDRFVVFPTSGRLDALWHSPVRRVFGQLQLSPRPNEKYSFDTDIREMKMSSGEISSASATSLLIVAVTLRLSSSVRCARQQASEIS